MVRLRTEPYRLLFPLAILLSWAGVLPWLLLGTGATTNYPSVYHAMTQVQGALTCFAFGFLLTFVPRRTGTGPVSVAMLATAALAPVATTAFAWVERWAVAQIIWCGALGALLVFIARRTRGATFPQKMHASFVWVPISVGMAIVAAFVAGYAAVTQVMWLHDASAHVILHGLFTGLVLGVGGILLPALTRGQDAALGKDEAARRRDRRLHILAAAVFYASFPLEHFAYHLAYALRALAPAFVLVVLLKLYRLPSQRGLSRKLLWLSAWMLPVGYGISAIAPAVRLVGLHVVFIGGFWLMAVTIASHVTLSHGGRGEWTRRSPWQLASCAVLLLVAVVARAGINLDPPHLLRWMAIAAGCFLLSSIPWSALVIPGLVESHRAENA